ncbi:MAG TPA: thiamine pyrophosphate-binding protein [Solirubrobacteraceae bacterium]|nr:thiamine pyrophosphate-binding protein [Solirubrobacteraceae bacterium]
MARADGTRLKLGAHAIVDAFERHEIERLYVFPGGTIAPVFDEAVARGIEIFTARHEQGAGYAALAAARITGRPQVAMVTSGPGVTNIVTAVADGYFDSTPLVVLTGQVGTGDMRGERPVRQRGFQEVDAVALMRPITKAQFLPLTPDELAIAIEDAFEAAMEGRPGPVLVDMPMNVQRGELSESERPVARRAPGHSAAVDGAVVEEIAARVAAARRPVIIAGQGVLLSHAQEELRRLAFGRRIPVSHSLLGLGAIPSEHELALGFHGHTGNQYAGRAIHGADLILAVGSRLDVRQTGTETAEFAPEATVVRIELDPGELEHSRVRVDIALQADCRVALAALNDRLEALDVPDLGPWLEQIGAWRREFALAVERGEPLKPQNVVATANRLTAGRDLIVTTGVGSHQHWVARHFDFDFPRRQLLTSGGHGAMGYDVPSAVGAKLADPDRTVLCFVGDGSLQMNIQELASIVAHELAIKIIVLDNNRLGIVSQFQLLNWGSDPTCGDKWNPDFAAIAAAYGIRSWTVADDAQLEPAIAELLESPVAGLVHCHIDPGEDIVPMLLGGQTMDRMWPNDG